MTTIYTVCQHPGCIEPPSTKYGRYCFRHRYWEKHASAWETPTGLPICCSDEERYMIIMRLAPVARLPEELPTGRLTLRAWEMRA